MTTFFVSRHPGAVQWARAQGLQFDRWVHQLWPQEVGPDDIVAGALPAAMAARCCERGAAFLHLDMLAPSLVTRGVPGRELTADEMRILGAQLQQLVVLRVHGSPALAQLQTMNPATGDVLASAVAPAPVPMPLHAAARA